MTFPISEAIKSNRMRKRLERLEEKLEAIKNWHEDIEMDPDDRYRLEKILEEK